MPPVGGYQAVQYKVSLIFLCVAGRIGGGSGLEGESSKIIVTGRVEAFGWEVRT